PIGSAKKRRKAKRPAPVYAGDWTDDLVYSSTGFIRPAVGNAITILANDPAWSGVFAWDEFSQQVNATRVPPWDANDMPDKPIGGEWTAEDVARAQAWCLRHNEVAFGP